MNEDCETCRQLVTVGPCEMCQVKAERDRYKAALEFAADWYKNNFTKPGEEHSWHPVYIRAKMALEEK